MQRILLLLSLFAVSPAWAEAPAYSLVKEKSFLKFFAIQNNAPVEGKFEEFTADIRFDRARLEQSSITAEIIMGSVSLKSKDIEQTIRLPEWLSVDTFPKATFKSTKITQVPQSENYYADGELSLRGKTVPVVLNFQLKNHGTLEVAEGFVTLRRNDFGVGQGEWAKDTVVKNDVRVELRIVAEKK